MKAATYKVIGLMSGSSLDGLDIAFCEFSMTSPTLWRLLNAETIPYPPKWESRLKHLVSQDALVFSKTHTYFGYFMGELVNQFIEKYQIQPDFIASHGHTVFHYPMEKVTVQIGDGAALATVTGLPVINNFRTHDIALDGEGTPLAPIADKLLFSEYNFMMNIGGIANITCNVNGKYIAFDTGYANQIFNALANQIGLPYDAGGQLAQEGIVNQELLKKVHNFPYFSMTYPKSLDNQWIQQNILPIYLQAEDTIPNKLRTAIEHLAQVTAQSIDHIFKKEKYKPNTSKMLVTGGGAFNTFLMQRISEICTKHFNLTVNIPSKEIIEFKEAILMALMGALRVENKTNCLSSVTGAKIDSIGGAIWQGTKRFI